MDWTDVVERMCALLDAHYLDGRIAAQVNAMLRAERDAEAFAGIATEADFAAAVSERTVGVSGDLHLRLRYSRRPLPPDAVIPESGRDPVEASATGFGVARAEVVDGVGHLDIRAFWPLSMAREAAVAAMHRIAAARTLIIDVRSSGGGEPEMVAFLASYLFDDRTQLSSIYFPGAERTIEWWTDREVPPPIFGGSKPIWILIGPGTISAAEGFAYDLHQWGRATLVGRRTAGAANFDYRYRVTDHLMFSVPSGYPLHPVSQANWEGVGVVPDVEAEDAMAVAAQLAVET